MEIWKKINRFEYEISDIGRVRQIDGIIILPQKPKTNNGYESYWQVKLINSIGKRTSKQIHNLMADTFFPDERYPIQKSIVGAKKGRPTRKEIIKKTIKFRYAKKVKFKNNNRSDLRLENLYYYFDPKKSPMPYAYETKEIKKYSNVFYKEEFLINQITKNTTNSNKTDNELIIKYLKGDNNSMGILFEKYKKLYKSALINQIIKNNRTSYKKRKENVLTLDDFIIEAQIKILGKVKKGRFDGRCFRNWSTAVVVKYLIQYWFIQNNKSKWLKDKTESFIN